MKLDTYSKKRNFKNTPEPKGEKEKSPKNKTKKKGELRFVVQYHEARAKHFDFRLEYQGVLVSFAVPKGFSFDPKVKRLAVHVEDHPLDYIDFEGVIPKGNYGAGTVQIFDKGTYTPLADFEYGFKKGHIKFFLSGEKLKGGWSLLKTDEKNWLLVKLDDEFAGQSDAKIKPAKNPFSSCSVQLATLTEKVPAGKNFLFEIKYDGYRVVAFGQAGKVKLLSRNGKDYTKKFPNITKTLENLAKTYTFVLDGEVVAFDENGRSDFSLLQKNIKSGGQIFYVVFDILAFQGEDLRAKPIEERKEILQRLIAKDDFVLKSEFVVGGGASVFAFAKKMDLEGVVAKKLGSTYNGTRDDTWLKIKCRKRQEFVIAGFCTTEKNQVLSALYLGVFEGDKFVFVGKVGTGFDESLRKELRGKLQKISVKNQPFDKQIKTGKECATWCKPKLVAEIEFAEFTDDGVLRQASFLGLRQDKDAKDVVLEVPREDKG